jgi:pimeloyl-ACP methyl ester carboxylesterase
VPTLVLHGEDDPLVPCEGGRDTAASIPGAKLKTIPGWGHDLPLELVDELAATIADHAKESAA